MAERFFGDIGEVKARLAKAVQNRRKEMSLSCRDVDEACYLGRGDQYPRCVSIEANPSLLTTRAFSLIAAALRLNPDEVLGLADILDEKDIAEIVKDMHEREIDVAAAVGGDVNDITDEQKGKVYALFRIMHELDEGTITV